VSVVVIFTCQIVAIRIYTLGAEVPHRVGHILKAVILDLQITLRRILLATHLRTEK
jgi:hypothetical protein